VTERRGGGRYRRFRRAILARDVICTEPGCRNSAVEVHHDPPLAEGGRELHPDDARGVCVRCHRRLTGELRDRLGLPYAPNGRAAAERVKSGPPRVVEGAISIPVTGPALVIDRDGAVRRIPGGCRG
jgi:5-methylcytosine-specific restriction endonuclease McrA